MEIKDKNLGKQARDKVTGFEGIIVGRIQYLYGCSQYGICPKSVNSEIKSTEWFDEGRVEITGEGVKPAEVAAEIPGGVNRDAPRK